MKASPRQQSLLLDLQDHDNLVARLRRKRTQLPERQELAALQGELSEAKTEFMAVQRELDAQNADISRLENDVETVRQRRRRDADLLSASTSSKEAQSLQGEIDTLEKRQGVLEERELDLMQASEETQARYDTASEILARVDERRAELTANLLEAERAIDSEIESATQERAGIAAELQRDLLDLYENLRQRGGVGAARLRGNVSEGSNMALAPAELQEIRSAAPDELVFCPGSGAILIRVEADDPR